MYLHFTALFYVHVKNLLIYVQVKQQLYRYNKKTYALRSLSE
jgi:hypothetical protein